MLMGILTKTATVSIQVHLKNKYKYALLLDFIPKHEIPGLYGIKQFSKVVPEIYTPNQQCTRFPVVHN